MKASFYTGPGERSIRFTVYGMPVQKETTAPLRYISPVGWREPPTGSTVMAKTCTASPGSGSGDNGRNRISDGLSGGMINQFEGFIPSI
jgi:hypothetical protein